MSDRCFKYLVLVGDSLIFLKISRKIRRNFRYRYEISRNFPTHNPSYTHISKCCLAHTSALRTWGVFGGNHMQHVTWIDGSPGLRKPLWKKGFQWAVFARL